MGSGLKVILAGHNLDIESLKSGGPYTPETISAAYARISRDPRPIDELREEARKNVESARKSNKAIIFSMGHKSIAEHSVFNFDIMGISRRAVEEIESKRLQSYTEKSQRYVTMDGDVVIPKEIQNTPLEQKFLGLIEFQNEFYRNNLFRIIEWHNNKNYSELYRALGCSNDAEKQQKTREGLGKEDARYSLAQATRTQLGMTTSARNLEVLISKLRSSNNEELKELGEKIFQEIDGIAPSVIKYAGKSDYFSKTRPELREFAEKLFRTYGLSASNRKIEEEPVRLHARMNRDCSILAGILFSSSDFDYYDCLAVIKGLKDNEEREIISLAKKYKTKHDPLLREFELGDRAAEIILSSSAYAQMKRHRMNTIIPQEYIPNLGFTVPDSIKELGLENELRAVVYFSDSIYNEMLVNGIDRSVADYALTNAHRRRILLDANNRQADAICMERLNLAAQWDIREIIYKYRKEIQKDSPITTEDLCGKHEFKEFKEK